MGMNWIDEDFIKLYTRDTVTWKLLPWQGKALLPLLLRKLDRAGVADVDGANSPSEAAQAVAELVDLPEEVVRPGLEALIKRGVLQLASGRLVAPNFIKAQEGAGE